MIKKNKKYNNNKIRTLTIIYLQLGVPDYFIFFTCVSSINSSDTPFIIHSMSTSPMLPFLSLAMFNRRMCKL